MWPSKESIQKCKEMGYCPSVFVLRPGQLLHINKGRIHAFRKQTSNVLPDSDCHAELRASSPPSQEAICVSVAWDWQFRGVTSEGINREIAASLECAAYNRAHKKRSLAIPETSLLQMVKNLPRQSIDNTVKAKFSFLLAAPVQPKPPPQHFVPSRETVLKGILPSLRFIVEQHSKLEEQARLFGSRRNTSTGPRIILKDAKPNSSQNPELVTVEPYGNDFFCRLCHSELSNLYFHCEGCEKILLKDFNICSTCFENRDFAKRIQMHPLISSKSALNHIGNPRKPPRQCKGCPCKQGPACANCGWCPCSCQCHQWFAVNFRFFTIDDEEILLQKVEREVGQVPCQYSEETKQRLQLLSHYQVPKCVKPRAKQHPTVNTSQRSENPVATDNNPSVDVNQLQNVPPQGKMEHSDNATPLHRHRFSNCEHQTREALVEGEPPSNGQTQDNASEQQFTKGDDQVSNSESPVNKRRRSHMEKAQQDSAGETDGNVVESEANVAVATPRKTRRPSRGRGSAVSKQDDDKEHKMGATISSSQMAVTILKLEITVNSKPMGKAAAEAVIVLKDVKKRSKLKRLFSVSNAKLPASNCDAGIHGFPSTPKRARKVGKSATINEVECHMVDTSPGDGTSSSQKIEGKPLLPPTRATRSGNKNIVQPSAIDVGTNPPSQDEAVGVSSARNVVEETEPERQNEDHAWKRQRSPTPPASVAEDKHVLPYAEGSCNADAGGGAVEFQKGMSGQPLPPAAPKNRETGHDHDIVDGAADALGRKRKRSANPPEFTAVNLHHASPAAKVDYTSVKGESLEAFESGICDRASMSVGPERRDADLVADDVSSNYQSYQQISEKPPARDPGVSHHRSVLERCDAEATDSNYLLKTETVCDTETRHKHDPAEVAYKHDPAEVALEMTSSQNDNVIAHGNETETKAFQEKKRKVEPETCHRPKLPALSNFTGYSPRYKPKRRKIPDT